MTRLMLDGVNSDAVRMPTSGLQLVAGYVDGLYAWSSAEWDRFPAGIVRVRIAVFASTDDGHVLDCEPGNATPAESVDWVLTRRRAGVDPTIYCNQHNTATGWPAVRAAFQARGVPEPHYWVADYDGVAVIPTGAVAKQYADNVMLGKPWDASAVAGFWPGVDPLPQPPTPAKPKEHDMILHSITGSPEVWALSGSLYWHVADPPTLQAYLAAGIIKVDISAAEHAAILAAVAAARTPVTITGSVPLTISGSGTVNVAGA